MEVKKLTFNLSRFSRKMVQRVLVASMLALACLPAFAQGRITVKGTVTSASDGQPLIGVSVMEAGVRNVAATDLDGNYEITVAQGATIEFSYIGFVTVSVPMVAGKTVYDIIMQEDSQVLEEVVVVGYGVQKKKLITGSTVQVKGDQIQKLSTTSAFTALQSQTPGVNITQNNGQPGAGFKVNIRGLGTIGGSSPLYVVDGVAGISIDNLNPSDIESIDVLKDAASAAIYGARAANGVILVTTKQGQGGKMEVSYDGYYGVQNIYKMPSLLNAQEYMAVQDEIDFNEGGSGIDWATQLGSRVYGLIQNGQWNGTNWLKEASNPNAPVQNHAVNLTGGNAMSNFSAGFSYTDQDGILGNPVSSHYTRYTGRMNSNHVVVRRGNLDILKIGENINFYHSKSNGMGQGNLYWNDVHNFLSATPLLPMYNTEGGYYSQADKDADGWVLQGALGNPIYSYATSTRANTESVNYGLNASVYGELQPIKGLVFRSQFNYKMSSWGYRAMSTPNNVSTTSSSTNYGVTQSAGMGHSWSVENTIAYQFQTNGHSLDFLVGQSFESNGSGFNVSVTNNVPSASALPTLTDFDHAWITNTNNVTSSVSISGTPWDEGALASFFGRINYNYKEKYLLTAIMRADGSSNFARGHRWGYFPSVSAGWVITNEDFMQDFTDVLSFFKLRGSWGQNGNCAISNFQYLATVAFDQYNVYTFGDGLSDVLSVTSPSAGAYADILPNENVTWETSEQLDLGFDARFFRSRLGLSFDWYKKTTKDWLVQAPVLATAGTSAPYINGGDVENRGVEVSLGWSDYKGKDFYYGFNANLSYNQNEVTRIDNGEGIIHGGSNVLSQGTTEMYRAQVGYPIGYFWGYQTAGVFQNQGEIEAWEAAGNGFLQTAPQPGDLMFVDQNKDGVINDDDKVMIGNPHPDFRVGFNFNIGWKGIDFSVTGAGAFGQQIAKSYRSFADSKYQNYTTEIFQRWTGEGSSNKYPRLTDGSNVNWQAISDIYMEDADYLKIQNVTLGYDFKHAFPRLFLSQLRVYFTAQNLYTFTNYSGMDPEVGYGFDQSWVQGIDLGYYPSSRTYMVGINIKF